jgi:hypothetical protein
VALLSAVAAVFRAWNYTTSGDVTIIGTSGETYVEKRHAINMAGVVRSLASTTPIYDKTGEK